MKYKLLILISLLPFNVYSEFNYSGYAYTSQYENNDFKKDKYEIAVNTNLTYKNFAIRTQVSNKATNYVKRLHLDIGLPYNTTFRVGRFSRISGFYNDVSDSPSTSRMGLLPQAPYNDLFINEFYNTMEGISLQNTSSVHKGSWLNTLSIGQAVFPEQERLQKQLYRFYIPEMEIRSPKNNVAFFSKYDSLSHSTYIEIARSYLFWAELDQPTTLMEAYIHKKLLDIDASMDTIRYGFSLWDVHGFKLSLEGYDLKTNVGQWSYGGNITIKKDLMYNLEVFTGYAKGVSESGAASDTFLGLSLDLEEWFAIIEYHRVTGSAWSHKRIDNTNSAILTVGYRF